VYNSGIPRVGSNVVCFHKTTGDNDFSRRPWTSFVELAGPLHPLPVPTVAVH
jgi:hypothetical protein